MFLSVFEHYFWLESYSDAFLYIFALYIPGARHVVLFCLAMVVHLIVLSCLSFLKFVQFLRFFSCFRRLLYKIVGTFIFCTK